VAAGPAEGGGAVDGDVQLLEDLEYGGKPLAEGRDPCCAHGPGSVEARSKTVCPKFGEAVDGRRVDPTIGGAMTDRSSIARPGFHKALFGHDPSQVDAALQELQARLETAERDAQMARARIRELEAAQPQAAAPTFGDLGGRLAAILSLAEEEAAEQRGAAQVEARKQRDDAVAAAETSQADADRYAERVRTAADLEAAEVLDEARRRASDVLEDAEREASARRAEAEALFETQQARGAAAAVELERSLAARRDQAASEIAAQLAVHENSLLTAEARAAELTEQSEAAYDEARGIAGAHIAQAEEQAALLLQRARAQADRITRSSEREVAAASARRDSINGQLDVLRQMLATLGGSDGSEQPVDEESAASTSARGEAYGHNQSDHPGEANHQGEEADASTPSGEPDLLDRGEPVWYETLQTEPSTVSVDPPAAGAVDDDVARAGSRARTVKTRRRTPG
jgi:hypothetical protein